MFEALSDRFSKIFSLLSKKKNLTEHNIADALAEIRRALLDSDVAFEVVRTFIEEVKEKCIGQEVFRTVQPGQQVVKIVHDQLTAILGDQQSALNEQRPLRVMMVGLQGSGKTTTAAKLALWLKKKGERPALVACDLYRPAATEQLKILGQQIEVPVFAYDNLSVNEIAQRALADANGNASVLIFDTAGRLQIDQLLMQEVQSLKEMIHPQEILLVVDSALGQESVRVSQGFHASLGLTGIILTKLDGDAKGGAALSMKRMVNVPIKFSGAGEKVEDFEVFYPERMASRILGMGDIVSLVEKAEEEFSQENASKLAKKLLKGDFTFEDLLTQLQHTKKLDSSRISRLLPNMPASQIKDDWAERIKHQ
ncbi:MAG: signal recognition particle protein [Opitutales bacterium]|nr:signal recognition particle protein [Opitutales bacterium]